MVLPLTPPLHVTLTKVGVSVLGLELRAKRASQTLKSLRAENHRERSEGKLECGSGSRNPKRNQSHKTKEEISLK